MLTKRKTCPFKLSFEMPLVTYDHGFITYKHIPLIIIMLLCNQLGKGVSKLSHLKCNCNIHTNIVSFNLLKKGDRGFISAKIDNVIYEY